MSAYGNDVWNYVFSLTRNPHQTDDIVQDVFLKIYRKLGSFRGDSSIKTWIFKIARNTVYDYNRSAFLRKVMLIGFVTESESCVSAEQEVMRRQASEEVWEQVMKLPVKHREALVLFAHHQMSLQEIADLLGVQVGTVKSRLYHARQKLSKWKEERQQDEND
ncbi:RNA polymerase sigma factor [Paenibacillus thermoaerophilus]|nr:RNA polymerase sigma factor [Paenibacillus thermoaerophilus]